MSFAFAFLDERKHIVYFRFHFSFIPFIMEGYIGEIKIFAGNYAPKGWMFCHGQSLDISEYEALYYVLGLTYGGEGYSTFNLPDLRGAVPVGAGYGNVLEYELFLGQNAGGQYFAPADAGLPYVVAQPTLVLNYIICVQGTFPSRW